MIFENNNIYGQESEHLHHLDVEVFYFNEKGVLKPSAYQALFAKLAERHLDMYGSGADQTMKHGLAWALISLTIDINKNIGNSMNLWAKTWYSHRSGPFFRRELVFYDKNEEVVFQGSTFSVLLDVKDRKVFRKRDLPFSLTQANDRFCTEAVHKRKIFANLSPFQDRRVYASDLDLLGHVNNRRYGDFAYDALSDLEQDKLEEMRRMEIYFISEMRKGDDFSISKAVEADEIFLRGDNRTKGDTAFDIVFKF